MKFYKLFRVDDGELYSAFEGWCEVSSSGKKVHYKVGEVAEDPKPSGEYCPGLMILLGRKESIGFLAACDRLKASDSILFALHEVAPKATVTIPLIELETSDKYSWLSAHTDALKVGKLVKQNR